MCVFHMCVDNILNKKRSTTTITSKSCYSFSQCSPKPAIFYFTDFLTDQNICLGCVLICPRPTLPSVIGRRKKELMVREL
jgi:hypothetical protein